VSRHGRGGQFLLNRSRNDASISRFGMVQVPRGQGNTLSRKAQTDFRRNMPTEKSVTPIRLACLALESVTLL
jgi:hypothetical protein